MDRNLRARFARVALAATIAASPASAAPPRDGLHDPGFGTQGIRELSVWPSPGQPFPISRIDGVAVDAQGRIYLLTWDYFESAPLLAVVRLDRRGEIDPEYGEAGRASVPMAGAALSWRISPVIVVEPDGTAFVAAIRNRDGSGLCTALHRLNRDGSHDSGFQPFPPDRCTDFGAPLAPPLEDWRVGLQVHQGQILLVGPTGSGGPEPGTGLARLTTAGQPVAGFGSNGLLRPAAWGRGLSLDGHRTVGLRNLCLSALDPSGQLDPDFGNGGCAPLAMPDPAFFVYDLLRDDSNRIVTFGIGSAWHGSICRACLSRRLVTGALDVNFNPDGLGPAPPGWAYLWPRTAPDARFVVPETVIARSGSRLAAVAAIGPGSPGTSVEVVALTADGEPDPRFGDESKPGRRALRFDGNSYQPKFRS
jgi:uncharacterized delta-60 repeat protein